VGDVLAIVSQKGGVGKTSTAINLAAALARSGRKTLLIDVDPQGSVRYGVGIVAPAPTGGLSDYLDGSCTLGDVVASTALPWLRVLLAGSVSDEPDHGAYQEAVATSPRFPELLALARARGYTVVADTPPGLGPVTRRVLAASQHAIVPLACEPLALRTTAQILRAVRDVSAANPTLVLAGVLLTMFEQGNPISVRVAEFVRTQMPAEVVLDIAIPRSLGMMEASAAGQPLVLRAPDDPAARAYIALAAHLAERIR